LFLVSSRCGRSAGVVINVHARFTIEVHHIRGAHKMSISGKFYPGPTARNDNLNLNRKIELYEQRDGRRGVRLLTQNLRSTTYYFEYRFTRTVSTRLFVRTENDYRNFAGESAKIRTSTY
jgi:hypothetical protein